MSIVQYADFILKKLNFKLKIKFDKSKKDGTKRKILDCSIAKRYGWKPKIDLKTGFKKTYNDYIKSLNE